MSTTSTINLINTFTNDASLIIIGIIGSILILLGSILGLQYGINLFKQKIYYEGGFGATIDHIWKKPYKGYKWYRSKK